MHIYTYKHMLHVRGTAWNFENLESIAQNRNSYIKLSINPYIEFLIIILLKSLTHKLKIHNQNLVSPHYKYVATQVTFYIVPPMPF